MKNVTNVDPMLSKIKNFYKMENVDLSLEVLWNYNFGSMRKKFDKDLDPKYADFMNLIFDRSSFLDLFICSHLYEVLSDNYGRCDFKFEGNRVYRNWVVKAGNVYFILSSKIELIVPDNNKINVSNAIAKLYIGLLNLSLKYYKSNRKVYGEGAQEIDKLIKMLEKKGLIRNNKCLIL